MNGRFYEIPHLTMEHRRELKHKIDKLREFKSLDENEYFKNFKENFMDNVIKIRNIKSETRIKILNNSLDLIRDKNSSLNFDTINALNLSLGGDEILGEAKRTIELILKNSEKSKSSVERALYLSQTISTMSYLSRMGRFNNKLVIDEDLGLMVRNLSLKESSIPYIYPKIDEWTSFKRAETSHNINNSFDLSIAEFEKSLDSNIREIGKIFANFMIDTKLELGNSDENILTEIDR